MTAQVMRPTPTLIRWRRCARKVRHQTVGEAHAVARLMRRKKGADLTVYRCSVCDGFHLGNRRSS